MHMLFTLILFLFGVASGQAVRVDTVTPDDLVRFHGNSVALEIDIPKGATVFTLSYGHVKNQYSYSTFLDTSLQAHHPERLRLAVYLPEIGAVSNCDAGRSEVTIVVLPIHSNGPGMHDMVRVCTPYPDQPASDRLVFQPLIGTPPTLDAWWPVFFGSWLSGPPESRPMMEADLAFVIQVGFLSGNSTTLPEEPPLKLADFLALDELRTLLPRAVDED